MIGVEINRKLTCPNCHLYEWHDCTIGIDQEENTCRNCNHLWVLHYDNPSKMYSQIVRNQIDRIRDAINESLGKIANHKWGALGKKDRELIGQVKIILEYTLKIIDTFTGD